MEEDKRKKNVKMLKIGSLLAGVALLVFGTIGLFLKGHDVLLSGSEMIIGIFIMFLAYIIPLIFKKDENVEDKE